jgi:hypothetical protein
MVNQKIFEIKNQNFLIYIFVQKSFKNYLINFYIKIRSYLFKFDNFNNKIYKNWINTLKIFINSKKLIFV